MCCGTFAALEAQDWSKSGYRDHDGFVTDERTERAFFGHTVHTAIGSLRRKVAVT